MAKQVVKVELYDGSSWVDAAAAGEVLTDAPIVLTQGLSANSLALRPASAALRLDNRTDKYRLSNPESSLYGKLTRNTPLKVSVGTALRSYTEASEWESDQTDDFRETPPRGVAWTDILANGLLSRIGQWTEPLKSPMTRQVSAIASLTGGWPLEDEADAGVLTQVVPGLPPGTFTGALTLGATERPAGAASSVTIGAAASLTGSFRRSTNSGWWVSFAARLAALPSSATYFDLFSVTDTVGRRWAYQVNNANYRVLVIAGDGTTLASGTQGYGTDDQPDGRWITYRIKATSAGFDFYWFVEGSNGIGAFNVVYAAATGGLARWTIDANAANLAGSYTSVFGMDDSSVNMTTTAANSTLPFRGYRDETIGTRFVRLMTELGLPYTFTSPVGYGTRRMGPQPVATFSDQLKQMVSTEDGLIYDTPTSIGLTFKTRGYRYRQTPAVTLTPADFPSLPKEVSAGRDVHNVVTASQDGGSSATVSDTTGPLGTAAPPVGVGEYRQTVDANVRFPEDLPQIANWWLRKGTVNLPKFPQLTVDLNALSGARIAAIEAVTVGDVVEITGFRENTVRLHVLGWTETIGSHTRSIVFTCLPDQQYVVGKWNSSDSRWDSASTTLKTAVNTTATSVTFRYPTLADQWSTTGVPYDVFIAGERLTVTAMGAPSLVSSAYDQVATVTRSVNNIVKSLGAGEPIHVATPGRWAL